MDVEFEYTRKDCVEIDARHYRNWFHAQRPLVGTEYVVCWFLLVFSLVAGVALLGFLGVAVWLGMAWYFVVGAMVLLVVVSGVFLEIMRPRREPVRGLFHELVVRLNLVDQQLAKVKDRRRARFRREEENRSLVLNHRYRLRLEPEGLTLTTEYPATSGTAPRQDVRWGWDAVSAVHLDDHLLSFALRDGQCIFIPRTAFADEDACSRFARTAETYRAAPPQPDTRIQARKELTPNRSSRPGVPTVSTSPSVD
jgi:hypothetical protein